LATVVRPIGLMSVVIRMIQKQTSRDLVTNWVHRNIEADFKDDSNSS
jgi:hypothetical protein